MPPEAMLMSGLTNLLSMQPAQELCSWVVNALWQAPLVVAAASLAARLLRPLGSRVLHSLWTAALLLELLLPGLSLRIPLPSSGSSGGFANSTFSTGAAITPGLHLPSALLGLLLLTSAVPCLFFAARLLWRLRRTLALARSAALLSLPSELAADLSALELRFGAGSVRLATSAQISGPVTLGLRRPLLLVPPHLLDDLSPAERNTLFAHELAHIQRRDFARNLACEVFALPLAFHPVLHLTLARIAETREMACDELAARALGGPQSYARLLLKLAARLATRRPAPPLHAIGILDANSFERRVMNLTRASVRLTLRRLALTVAACGLLATATCASALALRLHLAPALETSAAKPIDYKRVHLLYAPKPDYPPEAKASGPQKGTVLVAIHIGKDGLVHEAHIQRSFAPAFDRNALAAVRQYRFAPYLEDGRPVEFDLHVEVSFARF